MERPKLNAHILRLQAEYRKLLKKYESKVDVLSRRVERKEKNYNKLKYQLLRLNRMLYAQKLRLSKEKTIAKNSAYKKAVNNIVKKDKELLDIPKYHMALFELSQVFEKPEMFIILLLWASRYEYYSKKEFMLNFKNSPLKFEKYNNMLVREGYANKWEYKRSTYYISASGKDLVNKINKFVNNRMNG